MRCDDCTGLDQTGPDQASLDWTGRANRPVQKSLCSDARGRCRRAAVTSGGEEPRPSLLSRHEDTGKSRFSERWFAVSDPRIIARVARINLELCFKNSTVPGLRPCFQLEPRLKTDHISLAWRTDTAKRDLTMQFVELVLCYPEVTLNRETSHLLHVPLSRDLFSRPVSITCWGRALHEPGLCCSAARLSRGLVGSTRLGNM